jgi:hypothetical protein
VKGGFDLFARADHAGWVARSTSADETRHRLQSFGRGVTGAVEWNVQRRLIRDLAPRSLTDAYRAWVHESREADRLAAAIPDKTRHPADHYWEAVSHPKRGEFATVIRSHGMLSRFPIDRDVQRLQVWHDIARRYLLRALTSGDEPQHTEGAMDHLLRELINDVGARFDDPRAISFARNRVLRSALRELERKEAPPPMPEVDAWHEQARKRDASLDALDAWRFGWRQCLSGIMGDFAKPEHRHLSVLDDFPEVLMLTNGRVLSPSAAADELGDLELMRLERRISALAEQPVPLLDPDDYELGKILER